ncbi:MAG: hypothetical protein GF411_17005 [Candidatus Lokiarchaeota archaeon]|nr:hypothetical protein [Candidatus Lokiarchaeota archaeon]
MAEKTDIVSQFRCQQCNAPYPLGADDVIATCPYCGYTFEVGGDEIASHLIQKNQLSTKKVVELTKTWLEFAADKTVGKGIMKDIKIGKPVLQWIPTFKVDAFCSKYHLGGKKIKRGNEKVWKKIEGSENTRENEWVLARRHAASFGIREFIGTLDNAEIHDFSIDLTDNFPVLNAEIVIDDAERRAHLLKTRRERDQLKEEMDELFDYRLTMDIKNCDYIHVPYWLVRYNYRNGTFRVAISGSTAEVVLGELPVTKQYRIKKWAISLGMLIISALSMQALPYSVFLIALGDGDSDAWIIPLIIAAIGIMTFVAAVVLVANVLKYEIQVDADGEEREEESDLPLTLKDIGGFF